MISERVKKQQVPKEDDRSVIPVFKLATSKNHTIRISKMLFLFGKLAEKSYHQDFKTLLKKN